MKPMWHFIKRLVSDVFATCLLLAVLATSAGAAELTRIGVTVTDLGNPFFVRIARAIEQTARRIIGPNVQVFVVSSAYDLARQNEQIDAFIKVNDLIDDPRLGHT